MRLVLHAKGGGRMRWAIEAAREGIGIYTFIVIPVITLQNDFNLSVGGIDSRLTRRYQTLVKQHM
ncbi:hypothetical protein, partial [Candidatus Sodalis sp. SoCistrobi]|uniref:hypothetical protein n=1 Tax=Candidatus Sodalis sp. SoCistrobi TaxID=1922216 RepID=UPI00116097F5